MLAALVFKLAACRLRAGGIRKFYKNFFGGSQAEELENYFLGEGVFQ
jgi:hypothetical protein